MTTNTKNQPAGEVLPVSRDAVLAQFVPMLAAIPDAVDDDGSGIIAEILQATNLDGLNTSGTMDDSAKMIGRSLKITGLTKRASDLPDGLPFYLIVDYVDRHSGELGKFQTSATTIVAQLVKAQMLGLVPLIAHVVKADKPTKAGFYPHWLVIDAASDPNS